MSTITISTEEIDAWLCDINMFDDIISEEPTQVMEWKKEKVRCELRQRLLKLIELLKTMGSELVPVAISSPCPSNRVELN